MFYAEGVSLPSPGLSAFSGLPWVCASHNPRPRRGCTFSQALFNPWYVVLSYKKTIWITLIVAVERTGRYHEFVLRGTETPVSFPRCWPGWEDLEYNRSRQGMRPPPSWIRSRAENVFGTP